MKKLAWKIMYKVVNRWQSAAYRRALPDQVRECLQIKKCLERYRHNAQKKGIW